MTPALLFVSGGIELVDSVEPMWHMLTHHAAERSQHFARYFEERCFQERRAELVKKSCKGHILIEVALDPDLRQDLGYCISAVDLEGNGEIESLFVSETARGRGVGDKLVRRSMEWMDKMKARSVVVFTVYGSEEVLPFYQRYGFQPKIVLLERTKDRQ
jgi:GNAT superfamily N-acetyltransferase